MFEGWPGKRLGIAPRRHGGQNANARRAVGGRSPGKLRELALFRQKEKTQRKTYAASRPRRESQKTAGVGFVSAGMSR